MPLLAGPFCGRLGETVSEGVGVESVQEGAYAIRLDAPLTLGHGSEQDEIAAGTEMIVAPGDAARFPDYAASGEIANTGDAPAVVVGPAILAQEKTATPVPDLAPDVSAVALSRAYASEWRKLPAGPATVTLRRLLLPPGATLTPYKPSALETILIEEGRAALTFIPAGETEPSQPLGYGAGGAAPTQSVTRGARRLVSNDSQEPASILVVTITPADGIAGTPPAA